MNYTTILFDLDGTLLNTLPDLHASVNFALNAHSLPTRTIEQTRRAVGNGVVKLIARSVPSNTPEALKAQVLETFKSHYANHSLDQTVPYPGVVELLETLREKNVPVAVVSNKHDSAVKTICDHYFPGLACVAMGEREEMGVRKKPAPDAVFAALREMKADPASAVYVGDSEVDIETARNASLPCITVTWGFRDREELIGKGAALIADDTDRLAALLGL